MEKKPEGVPPKYGVAMRTIIHVRLPGDIYARMLRSGQTQTDFIRQAIVEKLEREHPGSLPVKLVEQIASGSG